MRDRGTLSQGNPSPVKTPEKTPGRFETSEKVSEFLVSLGFCRS
jgi:hypothetical protein